MTTNSIALTATSTQFYLLAVAAVVIALWIARRLGLVFFALALPGTLAHELAHFTMGWLSNGRPAGIHILPRRSARGYVLGSVTCHNVRWYNGLVIGFAPLALFPAAILLLRWRLQSVPQPDMAEAAWIYVVASLILAALPSWQDVRVALASSWLLIAGTIAGAAWYLNWFAGLAR